MPDKSLLPIDAIAAQRWAAHAHTESAWLHDEVARRMAERLAWIRVPVQRWAHWEPVLGGAQARQWLAAQYPDAECFEVLAQAQTAQAAIKTEEKKWWHRLVPGGASAPKVHVVAEPPEAAMQLVWANMQAHQASDPAALLADWLRALEVGGFLMFSCLGPDSLRELRGLYAELGWPPPAHDFTDMHDWGDRLVTAGFADPVMDMEPLTLTFATPERLLAELRGLGRNLHPERHPALRTPAWRARLLAAMDRRLRPGPGEPLTLTFELIYGHAIRPAPRPPQAPMRFTRRRGESPAGA